MHRNLENVFNIELRKLQIKKKGTKITEKKITYDQELQLIFTYHNKLFQHDLILPQFPKTIFCMQDLSGKSEIMAVTPSYPIRSKSGYRKKLYISTQKCLKVFFSNFSTE